MSLLNLIPNPAAPTAEPSAIRRAASTSPRRRQMPAASSADASSSHRAHERTRFVSSLLLAALGITALVSVLPTPLHHLLQGLFGAGGVVGPVTAATSVVFWSVGLLVTARGLRRGHRLAWMLTLTFLGVASGMHLARHDDLVETVLLSFSAALLVLRRRAFVVPVSKRITLKALVILGMGLALGVLARVMRETHPHVGSGSSYGGSFGASMPLGFGHGFGATFLLVTALVALAILLWGLLSPRAAHPLSELMHHRQREHARSIVASYGQGTLDYFALRDDKRWFFHVDSVVAYTVRFGVCLVSPDPIGPPAERSAVWAAFLQHARTQGWSVSILGASQEWIEIYRSFGLHPVYLGDEAVVDCSRFTLEGRAMRSLRQGCNRVDRAGYTVSFHDPTDLDKESRQELLELATLSREGDVERGFSMTLSRILDIEDTGLMLSITRDPEGRARAFIQWTPAPGINGWSLDVMRYDTGPDTPNGVMDHLIVATIQHLTERGETGLGLNFAVIRTLVANDATTTLGQLGQRLLQAASGRTEIASLCRYNEKFSPTWQPRYLVLDSMGNLTSQGLVIAAAEGLSELPLIGRFMTGARR